MNLLNKNSRIENELPSLPKNARLISSCENYKNCVGYAIDESGTVYTCKAHNMKPFWYDNEWRILKPKNNKHGYLFVIMSNFGKDVTARVHKLVASAFIPNIDNLPIINHKDGNKLNNHISNLEWCTHVHNAIHAIENNLRDTAHGERIPNSTLKDSDIPEIFAKKKSGLLNKEIGAIYNIDESTITRILNGKAWKHISANLARP